MSFAHSVTNNPANAMKFRLQYKQSQITVRLAHLDNIPDVHVTITRLYPQ